MVMGGRDGILYCGEIDYRKERLDAVQVFDGMEEAHMQIRPTLTNIMLGHVRCGP